MKIEVHALLLFATLILTNAVEVTREDPLVSYLLAKIQQLESKIMVRSNARGTN